jgi:hypothetical protein
MQRKRLCKVNSLNSTKSMIRIPFTLHNIRPISIQKAMKADPDLCSVRKIAIKKIAIN